MKNIDVQIYNISTNDLPAYSNPTDSGADVRADFSRVSDVNSVKVFGGAEIVFGGPAHNVTMLRLDSGARAIVPTGLFVSIPEGYEIQVRPRSGLAIKEGLTVINTPGTIDSPYRGEIGIPIINLSDETRWIEHGERIAQLVLQEVPHINWNIVNSKEELGNTDRGEGGFNSTGKN